MIEKDFPKSLFADQPHVAAPFIHFPRKYKEITCG